MSIIISLVLIFEETIRANIIASILLTINIILFNKNKEYIKHLFPVFLSYLIISYKIVVHDAISAFLVILFLFIFYELLKTIINNKISFTILIILSFIMRMAQLLVAKYRFGGVTLYDLYSIPTALSIASTYKSNIGFLTFLLITLIVISVSLYLIFIKN